jgi:RHS repeat-associated protein
MSTRKTFSLTSPLMRILLALGLLLAASAGHAIERVTYYHNDALGSPVAATDRNGTLLWRESYAPYGERLTREASSKDAVWYTGKQEEAAFGVNYFGARWYDPRIGRFMGVDPAGFTSDNIQSFNRYAYANNNPFAYVDPDGNFAIPGAVVAAVSDTATQGLLISAGLQQEFSLGSVAIAAGLGAATGGIANVKRAFDAAKLINNAKTGSNVAKGAKELKPTLIQENPRNLIPTQTKSEMSGSQVKRLTKDMKQNGYDQSKPVDAWRNPETGRLEIQDGHHRTEAAKKAGLDKIPVQVWE